MALLVRWQNICAAVQRSGSCGDDRAHAAAGALRTCCEVLVPVSSERVERCHPRAATPVAVARCGGHCGTAAGLAWAVMRAGCRFSPAKLAGGGRALAARRDLSALG